MKSALTAILGAAALLEADERYINPLKEQPINDNHDKFITGKDGGKILIHRANYDVPKARQQYRPRYSTARARR